MASFLLLFVLIPTLFMSVARTDNSNDKNRPDHWTQRDWQDWHQLYNRHNIIRDISDEAVPENRLHVYYGRENVHTGTTISQSKTTHVPTVRWDCDTDNNYNGPYALIMVDIDVPLKQGKEFVHWRIDKISDCHKIKGSRTAPYVAPTPAPASGPHRYLLMIFRIDYTSSSVIDSPAQGTAGRLGFSTKEFIKKHGRPVAGTFFLERPVVL